MLNYFPRTLDTARPRSEAQTRPLDQRAPRSEIALGGRAKRGLDIFISATTLVLLSPIMLMLAALIACTTGLPVFYSQKRVGFSGREFSCYKFRTMVTDADVVLQNLLATDPAAAAEWKRSRKLRSDPRITRLGHILRKSSLDELPQLFNILVGDMSCIGPRPIPRDELLRYGPYEREYLSARPGLTGLWQVSGRNSLSYSSRIALDRFYVRRWSFWLDLLIVLKTIPALLNARDTS
jgi:exopolysaccharide production protein ExoY